MYVHWDIPNKPTHSQWPWFYEKWYYQHSIPATLRGNSSRRSCVTASPSSKLTVTLVAGVSSRTATTSLSRAAWPPHLSNHEHNAISSPLGNRFKPSNQPLPVNTYSPGTTKTSRLKPNVSMFLMHWKEVEESQEEGWKGRNCNFNSH